MNDRYSGMTVNERLYVSGHMDEFDIAVRRKDVERIKVLLRGVKLDEGSIKNILKAYGLES
jgi:hypothetical protein